MASPELDEPADRESSASDEAPGSSVPGGYAEGLGLLVWLGQLARDGSARQPSRSGAAELLDVPRSIGRFQLQGLLGTGAYGAVFRAVDTQLGRQVALKLAWPGVLMDPVAGRRFVEEPKTVAALKHRGIVEVYDSGEIEMAAFIALELIDGPTLGQWLKQQEQVGPRLASQIVRSVAAAVHYAHERGIVHRDLKPSNILLRPCDNGDAFGFEPVVTDFGLARRPGGSEMSMLTGTHAIIGTDHYMSPEQAAGRKDDVGPASDVFSLGVILYELVAGCRPFEGDSSEQVRRRIQQDEAPLIRPWRKSVPKDLETIALKSLEKSPSRRYASGQELADDLGRFLDRKPIHARQITPWRRGWKFAQRKPLVVALASMAILCVLSIAGLVGAWVRDRKDSERRVEVAEMAATVSDRIERQHRYVATIRHAAESLKRGSRRNVLELLGQCRGLAREPMRCGIEWDYLWSQVHDFDVTLDASRQSIHSVRFSPQGDSLISAGEDGRVILWGVSTWTKRSEFNANVGEVRFAEPSPDGSLLAVAGTDGRVVVRRMADQKVIFDEAVVEGRVFDGIWLGDNYRLAVGGEDAVLTVIDPLTGQRRSTAPLDSSPARDLIDPNHPIEIAGLAYIHDTDSIAVIMKPSGLRVIDVSTLAPIDFPAAQTPEYNPACSLPIGPGFIALRTAEQQLRVRSVADGRTVAEIPQPNVARAIRYSASSDTLAFAFIDGTVETWNAQGLLAGSRPQIRRFAAHNGRAVTLDFSPDGNWLASGGEDGQIRLWNQHALRDPYDALLGDRPTFALFSPCGRWLAVVIGQDGQPGRTTMFDARMGQRLWMSAGQPDEIPRDRSFPWLPNGQITFDPTGDEVVFLHPDFSVCGHDSRTGQTTKVYQAPSDVPLRWLQVTPDGRSLVAGHIDTIKVVDRTSGITVRRPAPATRSSLGIFRTLHGDLSIEHDSQERQVFLCADSQVEPVAELGGFSVRPHATAVSQDGRYLAIAGKDRIIYVWDLSRAGPPTKCIGHEVLCQGMEFAADGATLVSHAFSDGLEGTVRFWHVATGAQFLTIGSREAPVLCMGLSPAGDLLALGVEYKGRYGLKFQPIGAKRSSPPK